MTCSTQILVVLLIGCAVRKYSFNQSEALPTDLGSASHQYGVSGFVTQMSFCEGSSGDLVKSRLFSQVRAPVKNVDELIVLIKKDSYRRKKGVLLMRVFMFT